VGLFVGPTGTGKTQLAKALSEALYPGVGMVRINMNQMISDHMSSMLTGAAPGYVGYGKDTPFIAQLKANSRRVILFDEVEKAAKGVLDNLLNMLDEGNFTTARGEELDLTSAIIILSSNALADQFHKQTVGFSQTGGDKAINDGNIAQRLIEAKAFSPEFVNRMDDVVVFSELSDKEVDLIARKGIEKIIREFSYRNITVKDDDVIHTVDELRAEGFSFDQSLCDIPIVDGFVSACLAEANSLFVKLVSQSIATQDDNRRCEIQFFATGSSEVSFVQHVQEVIKHTLSCLFYFVEQNDSS
jgi:ATP-dependent Clp protease ATP-binding subunit ClpA